MHRSTSQIVRSLSIAALLSVMAGDGVAQPPVASSRRSQPSLTELLKIANQRELSTLPASRIVDLIYGFDMVTGEGDSPVHHAVLSELLVSWAHGRRLEREAATDDLMKAYITKHGAPPPALRSQLLEYLSDLSWFNPAYYNEPLFVPSGPVTPISRRMVGLEWPAFGPTVKSAMSQVSAGVQ